MAHFVHISYRNLFILLISFILPVLSFAQSIWPDNLVMKRNFPLLNLIYQVQSVHDPIKSSPIFNKIYQDRLSQIEGARNGCQPLPACIVEAFAFSDEQIDDIGYELSLLQKNNKLGSFVQISIRNSGSHKRHTKLNDEELIAQAWKDSAKALNRILRVYALAEKPLYPAIDSSSLDPATARTKELLTEALMQTELFSDKLFFTPTYRFAELLLYLDERENAGFFPNIDNLENNAAKDHVRNINWSSYPYSAILVLGDGPNITGMRLGQFGKLRVMQAARMFKDKKAPFIVVSGGNVHPARTVMNEAVEMKRELMERYGISEKNIVIEPFARHTTTNFRNAVRLMNRYNFPLTKKALVTSSKTHIDYCLSEVFKTRLMNELGYLPIQWGQRNGLTELEFLPDLMSLHVDALDPLDP